MPRDCAVLESVVADTGDDESRIDTYARVEVLVLLAQNSEYGLSLSDITNMTSLTDLEAYRVLALLIDEGLIDEVADHYVADQSRMEEISTVVGSFTDPHGLE